MCSLILTDGQQGEPSRYPPLENSPYPARALLTNATYLENEGVTIGGLSLWGSLNTPEFFNWAFMYPRGPAARKY
jgi:hypothetical protein